MFSDEEAYEVMKTLVAEGKYKKAYEFCTAYKCKGNALKTSLECSKDILKFITDNMRYQKSFVWSHHHKDGLDNIYSKINMNILSRAMSHKINELRSMFDINRT